MLEDATHTVRISLIEVVSFKLELLSTDKSGHIGYDYSESNHPRWAALEEALVSSANNGIIPVTHRPTIQCFTNKTDNRFNPVAYVGGRR